jgi:uncharacterized BrkB/YihY/UPF0761 family membrane protein
MSMAGSAGTERAPPPGRKGRPTREQALRALTFWLRPAFVLRVVNRFQKIAGFDRAVALASSMLTATIPLSIVLSAIVTQLGGRDTAERIIDRYDLTGGGAEAVRDIFSPASGTSTSLGLVGLLFLMLTVLSFTRGMQRLFEQAWELKPLSVRNTANGLIWIAGLVAYVAGSGSLHAVLGRGRLELLASVATVPLSLVFFTWTGWVLSAKRIPWRQLRPFGVLAAGLTAVYGIGAAFYVPQLFSTYATRYGVIGAVFAMISALFCLAVVVVGSAAAGREIHAELTRIAEGRRPAEDEVRREWDGILAEARSRWGSVRRRGR